MARNARQLTAPIDHDATINADQLAADHAASAQLGSNLVEIDERFGDGTPYDRVRLMHEIRFHLKSSVESMLEAGSRLVRLKEHEPHGSWLETLGQLDMAPRGAQRLMQLAVKFESRKLTPITQSLSTAKLIELVTVEDDSLEGLAEGGTVAGFTLDEIGSMTSNELRAALRKEREERTEETEQNERLLASKDKKLNQLSKKTTVPWDERIAGLVEELHTCSLASSECLTRVYQVAEAAAIAKLENDDGMHQQQELAGRVINDVNLLVQKVAAIQGFVYDHFMQYVQGATPVLGEPVEPSPKRGKKG